MGATTIVIKPFRVKLAIGIITSDATVIADIIATAIITSKAIVVVIVSLINFIIVICLHRIYLIVSKYLMITDSIATFQSHYSKKID